MKVLNVELTPDKIEFVEAINKANQAFKESQNQTEPIFLIGLTQSQCALLKDTFEKAKRFDYAAANPDRNQTDSLYEHIYLQVAANKNLLK